MLFSRKKESGRATGVFKRDGERKEIHSKGEQICSSNAFINLANMLIQ